MQKMTQPVQNHLMFAHFCSKSDTLLAKLQSRISTGLTHGRLLFDHAFEGYHQEGVISEAVASCQCITLPHMHDLCCSRRSSHVQQCVR